MEVSRRRFLSAAAAGGVAGGLGSLGLQPAPTEAQPSEDAANRQVIRDAYQAYDSADWTALESLLADEVVLFVASSHPESDEHADHVPGKVGVMATYEGKAAVMGFLQHTKSAAVCDGTLGVTLGDVRRERGRPTPIQDEALYWAHDHMTATCDGERILHPCSDTLTVSGGKITSAVICNMDEFGV